MIPLEKAPIYAPTSYNTRDRAGERNSIERSVFMRELVLSGNQLTKLKLQTLAPTLRGAHIGQWAAAISKWQANSLIALIHGV